MVIKSESERGFSMECLYKHIGYSRQGYAQGEVRHRERESIREVVLKNVEKVRERHPRLGSRRIYQAAGIKGLGVTRFEKLMSEEGLTLSPRKRWIKTTDSRGKKHIYRNLTNGIKVLGVNELVVGDLTYYRNESGLYYLFFLQDVYSSLIVGFESGVDKGSDHAQEGLEMLVRLRGKKKMEGVIHHTDRGSEYRSDAYIGRLRDLKMQISMAKTCMENGYAERLNGVIKNDYLDYLPIRHLEELKKALKEVVYRYNYEAPQERLGMRTPIEYEKWLQSTPKEEHPVLIMFDFEKGAERIQELKTAVKDKFGEPNLA